MQLPLDLHIRQTRPVLGVPIDAIDLDQALTRIITWAHARDSRYVVLANAHVVVTATQEPEFGAAVAAADMATPDGAPVAWMLARLGGTKQERISGPDLTWALLERCEHEHVSVYFFGGSERALALLVARVNAAFPSLLVAGFESPPFRPMTAQEEAAVVQRFNDSGAGLVFVGLGCPKQELWMQLHRDKVKAVMLGVGAAFDFHAGTLRRAPRWMRDHGLEWLHRLAKEPRRLWRRYLVTNTLFILRSMRQLALHYTVDPRHEDRCLPDKVTIFGMTADNVDMAGAVGRVEEWLIQNDRLCRFVVTANVDHVVTLNASLEFRDAYQHAAMVLVDGNPIVWASRLLGVQLQGTVPGSDLVPAIFDHVSTTWDSPLAIYLLGAGPGVAERAKVIIERRWRQVRVVGVHSPAFGFEKDEDECLRICDHINQSGAALLVVGLGAPKQELWVHKHAAKLDVNVALCAGATIDFLAGEKKRAPLWMRRWGLEWFHRMLSEPRRLTRRYAHDAVVFPRLVVREFLRNKGK